MSSKTAFTPMGREVEADYTRPLIAAGALLFLFLLRIPSVYRALQGWLGPK